MCILKRNKNRHSVVAYAYACVCLCASLSVFKCVGLFGGSWKWAIVPVCGFFPFSPMLLPVY